MNYVAKIFSGLAGIYVFSYIILSASGAYAPSTWGQWGVKRYQWAPAGFYDSNDGGWTESAWGWVYAPLWFADIYLWHSNGHYPEVSDPRHPDIRPKSRHK